MSEEIIDPPFIESYRHKILVVDDNPATRYATARVLRAARFDIVETDSGADAIRLADATISTVVLDVHLPDIDGFQVCKILRGRRETSSLPIIYLSAAHIGNSDKVKGLDSGANAYLTHPAEPAVLIATVHALIRARMAEAAMRQSDARFRAIYDQALSGICLLNKAGCFVEMNPAMLELLQLHPSQVSGKSIIDLAPREWKERVQNIITERDCNLWRGEFPLLNGAGEIVYLEWNISSQLETDVSVAIVSNISERIYLQQQREQALECEQVARASAERLNHMKDEFIAVLSHELRTPLNAITGWTHVLQKFGGTPETVRGLEAIERNAKLQSRLISDLLDVSRLNVGKLSLERGLVDPADLVASAVTAIQLTAKEKQITFIQDLENSKQRLMWLDSVRFQQILWNLLTNAVKFSHPNSVVDITLRVDSDGLMLRVRDYGEGINADFIPYLFDRFTQSSPTNSRYHGGLGLGLSITKNLVELHNGTINATSKGLGEGATFEIVIPMANPLVQPGGFKPDNLEDDIKIGESTTLSIAGLNVLVVEDNIEAQQMLDVILGERGAHVRLAKNYQDALDEFDIKTPDVLVSDIGLPGKDGYELMRELRRRESLTGTHHVPAIALTAFTRIQDGERAFESGFNAHCPKPLRPESLVSTIIKIMQP